MMRDDVVLSAIDLNITPFTLGQITQEEKLNIEGRIYQGIRRRLGEMPLHHLAVHIHMANKSYAEQSHDFNMAVAGHEYFSNVDLATPRNHTTILPTAKKVERPLTPTNPLLDWWAESSQLLLDADKWDAYERKHANDTDSMQQLAALRYQWRALYRRFAGFSSEQLFNYYQQMIIPLEIRFIDVLQYSVSYPVALTNSINKRFEELKQLKKAAVCSMLHRLKCAEKAGDMQYDDSLNHTLQQMHYYAHLRLAATPAPAVRRTLTPQLISTFVNIIIGYNDQFIINELNQLKMRTIPLGWPDTLLARQPLVIYFVNTIDDTLAAAPNPMHLATDVIEQNSLEDGASLLNRLAYLVSYVKTVHNASSLLEAQLARYASFLQPINQAVNTIITQVIDNMLPIIFSDYALTTETIAAFVKKIKQVNTFKTKIMDKDYSPVHDVILALAINIKNILKNNRSLSATEISHVVQLIRALDPSRTTTEIEYLQQTLNSLRSRVDTRFEYSDASLVHLLVHFLETPTSVSTYPLVMQRHKQIAMAGSHKQPWDDSWQNLPPTPAPTSGLFAKVKSYFFPPKIISAQAIMDYAYAKNVLLKVIRASAEITVDNFDSNPFYNRLLNIARAADKLPEMENEYSKYILVKLNQLDALRNYLRLPTPGNVIDFSKLLNLLARIKKLFSVDQRKILTRTIAKASYALIKDYWLQAINQHTRPDLIGIHEVDRLFHMHTLRKLREDAHIRAALAEKIKEYKNDNPALPQTLALLIPPKHMARDNLSLAYALKHPEHQRTIKPADMVDTLNTRWIDTVIERARLRVSTSEISEFYQRMYLQLPRDIEKRVNPLRAPMQNTSAARRSFLFSVAPQPSSPNVLLKRFDKVLLILLLKKVEAFKATIRPDSKKAPCLPHLERIHLEITDSINKHRSLDAIAIAIKLAIQAVGRNKELHRFQALHDNLNEWHKLVEDHLQLLRALPVKCLSGPQIGINDPAYSTHTSSRVLH